MQKTGFIGFGSMGSVMIKALLDTEALHQNEVIVTTRTREKLNDFTKRYPHVEIVSTVTELGPKCRRVFICTGTMDVKGVLLELVTCLHPNTHIIITTGNIDIKSVEAIFTGKVTKIMPNQLCEIGEGITLICHNDNVLPTDKEFIKSTFERIGKVKEIKETQFDLGADLCSCAPAFFASILKNFVEATRNHGNFSDDELKEMIIRTCHGTSKLMMGHDVALGGFISRVATRGGITEEGVKILDARLPAVFDDILKTTLTKRKIIKKRTQEQYSR